MVYPDEMDQQLIKVFAALETEKEVEHFLRDLMTETEIKEMSRRFQIAKRLWLKQGSYLEIASDLKTSTTTVTRVADWLFKQSEGGYRTVLNRLFTHSA
jgi:TrpR-related protein YerC/YecD